MLTSNLSHSSAPCVNAVADHDPSYFDNGRASLSLLDNGRVTSESEFESDDTEDDFCIRPFAIDFYAIDIRHPVFSQPYDVPSATSDGDDASVTTAIPSGVASSKTDEATDVEDDDPGALLAQIDSGAFTSYMDQQQMLHQHREFSPKYPCLITLIHVREVPDIVPKDVGYRHVQAPNTQGHIAVRTFYHPSLGSTVIGEHDFLRVAGQKPKDFSGDRSEKSVDAGTFTFHASHCLRRSHDVYVHGTLRHGKCYMHPLLSPALDLNQPLAIPWGASAAAFISNPERVAACKRATILALNARQEGDAVLDKCPIGIQAKQIDEPAGSHMTCFATAYSQRLSIDFSVSGAINLSDDLMKPLGWILHDRHDRRMITIADMTTAIMSMLAVVARAAPVLPSSDNLTVLAYTLSPSSAPCVNSVSDNVPLSFGIGRVSIGLCSLCPWFALLLSKVHFLLYRLNATYLLNLLNRGGCWRTDE